ncbi:hypothetical protein GP486_008716 [Trichoglossum hirsutum]|uniref:Uncharacterized protein n=1 Tax=Trichoglossum hirsutum TaxID=265104 RepID=A0A9P8I5T2_9PEZI|nr:hypothetical protein GP486_008716 [Trichoglossum hirsutum]
MLSSPLFLSPIASPLVSALAQSETTGGSHTTLSSVISSSGRPSTSTGSDGTASTISSPLPSGATSTAVTGSTHPSSQSSNSSGVYSTTSSRPTSATSTFSSSTTPTPTSTQSPQQSLSPVQRRNLILILALGLGVILTAVAIWLSCRLWRRRKAGASFFGRGSTPIDDEEIQTWRKQAAMTSAAAGSHAAEKRSSLNMVWPAEKQLATVTTTKAPNARMGLTDEVVPGAEPFVPLPKRSTSRGLHRPKHMRSKSARSSISDRPPTPYAVEDNRTIMSPQPQMPGVPGKDSQPEDH